MPIFVKNIGSRAVRVPRLCRWQPGAPTTRSSVSVGRCREDGRNFRGTIPVLCLRRPHAKSLALLPDSLHSPALVKLAEAATAVTIPARHMPFPVFGKPLTCRDLPAANGSASDSDSRGIAVRQCARILSHSGAKQTSNRDRPFENTVRPHFSDRKQISPPRPKPGEAATARKTVRLSPDLYAGCFSAIIVSQAARYRKRIKYVGYGQFVHYSKTGIGGA